MRVGYRHIDAAMLYGNQEEVDGLSSSKLPVPLIETLVLIQVGAALKKVVPSVVKREELFIVTKVNAAFDRRSLDPALLELNVPTSFGTRLTIPKMSNQKLPSRSNNSGSTMSTFIVRATPLCMLILLKD